MNRQEHADVVIVGGAIVGSCIAAFLAGRPDFDGRIVVVERDTTFRTASTTLSAASIRQQFSTPLNIEISRFGLDLVRHPDRYLGDGDAPADFGFVENGYLFLAMADGLPMLERNHRLQRSLEVDVDLLSPAELRAEYPWMHVDDLAAGSIGRSGEGWFDAYALLQAVRRAARARGVEERTGDVVALDVTGDRVAGVVLADGSTIAADWVVNAAGPHAATVAAFAGVELPVRPRKRSVYHFEAATSLGAAPLVIDPSGVYVRPEAPNYLTGYSPHGDEPDPDTFELTVDHDAFDRLLWPAIAHRIPGFDRLRLLDSWAGHYEVNVLDHNAIVGPHTAIRNLLFANGFSGHGLQQAPAVGRALAEWISTGHYETLDLSPLGYERVERGEPIVELNVV